MVSMIVASVLVAHRPLPEFKPTCVTGPWLEERIKDYKGKHG